MKKVAKWLAVISLVVFVIAWGIMGLKILDNLKDFAAVTISTLATVWQQKIR